MRYRLDDLEIDLHSQSVVCAGKQLDVKGLSFQLLACLVQQGRRVVSYDELIEAVWAPAVVNEETVTQRVRLLREALGDDGRKPRYIRSVRGQGYQLCIAPRSTMAPTEIEVGTRKVRLYALTLSVVVTLVAVIAFLIRGGEPSVQRQSPRGDVARLLERADYYAGIGQAGNNERAIALYQQALQEAPENVDARLGLSLALSASTCQFDASPGAAAHAGQIAKAVLAAEASNARAHAALAYSLDCRGFIDEAIAAYERAIKLDPEGRRDAAASVAHLYAIKGRLADALRLNVHALPLRDDLRFVGLQLAHVLDLLGFHVAAEQRYAEEFALYPDNVFSNVAWPGHLFAHGRLADAKAVLDEALARPARPELLMLAGEIHLLEGDRRAAHARFAAAAAMREHLGMPGTLATLYGERPPDTAWVAARVEKIKAVVEKGDRWPNNWLEVALLEWHRGDDAAAMRAMHAAIDSGYRNAAYLRASPLFSAMREQPAFAAVLDRIASETARERERVLAADWLPAPLLSAGR